MFPADAGVILTVKDLHGNPIGVPCGCRGDPNFVFWYETLE